MPLELTPEEARVLGSLIEKDMATPEYYPMSLNALTNACNQKTNRDPMTSYGDDVIRSTLDSLRRRNLITVLSGGENRVPKYGHRTSEILNVNNRELALLCVLLLRGPQTLNELKTRTERMYEFDDLESVEGVLSRLGERGMAVQLPKLIGMREPRWMHLLAGEVDMAAYESAAAQAAVPQLVRTDGLAERVARLEAEIDGLKAQFAEFRRQFD
ncbi:MAG: DUF480 domain-containing protein [Acidobacteria bacterium]|nr:DUF480 domain-containing protein [Acidobacteriota bacterium]